MLKQLTKDFYKDEWCLPPSEKDMERYGKMLIEAFVKQLKTEQTSFRGDGSLCFALQSSIKVA